MNVELLNMKSFCTYGKLDNKRSSHVQKRTDSRQFFAKEAQKKRFTGRHVALDGTNVVQEFRIAHFLSYHDFSI